MIRGLPGIYQKKISPRAALSRITLGTLSFLA